MIYLITLINFNTTRKNFKTECFLKRIFSRVFITQMAANAEWAPEISIESKYIA